MTLEELLWHVNDSAYVKIFAASTSEMIDCFDGKDSISETLNGTLVTDIFAEGNALCVEVNV